MKTDTKISWLLFCLITALVLVYGVIYPNLSVVISSFQRAGSWTLANYREMLSQAIVIEAIVSSRRTVDRHGFVLRACRRAARVSF